jgi:hypothetical protein
VRYVPQSEAAAVPHVVVDGAATATTVLTLSHWPGSVAPELVWADTSAEMVLRYIESGRNLHAAADVATNNHFDQDGTAGLYAIIDPDGARRRGPLVADLARAGDFATYRHRQAARASMALSTLAGEAPDAPYPEQCAGLYVEALGLLPELLDHPDRFHRLWRDEDAALDTSEAAVRAGLVNVREIADVDLAVITVDRASQFGGGHRFASNRVDGLHPMALHGLTTRSRLLVFHGDVYRYTDRYEGWVQYRSRAISRRADLAPLATMLTAQEDGVIWEAEPPDVLTPQLAPATDATSSLSPAEVEATITSYLRSAPVAFDPFQPR